MIAALPRCREWPVQARLLILALNLINKIPNGKKRCNKMTLEMHYWRKHLQEMIRAAMHGPMSSTSLALRRVAQRETSDRSCSCHPPLQTWLGQQAFPSPTTSERALTTRQRQRTRQSWGTRLVAAICACMLSEVTVDSLLWAIPSN